jgi:hypothetical protein
MTDQHPIEVKKFGRSEVLLRPISWLPTSASCADGLLHGHPHVICRRHEAKKRYRDWVLCIEEIRD